MQGQFGLTSPYRQNIIKNFAHRNPLIPGNRLAILVVQVDSIHQLSVDIELLMKGGTVTDTDRGGVAVSGEVAPMVRGRFKQTSIRSGAHLSSTSGISVSPRIVNMIGKAPSGPLDLRNLSLIKFIYASASSVKPMRKRI